MTVARLISPTARAAVMVVAGTVLLLVPLAGGLRLIPGITPAAGVTGAVVGAIALAVGIAGTDTGGRGTLPLSVQEDFDRGLSVGLLLTAAAFAIAGQPVAAALFGAIGLVTLLVTSFTRYAEAPAR